jgi:crotonobetainyl-CoA:carnitine CoA-transferase CaiB-like acyl-CoA transferase
MLDTSPAQATQAQAQAHAIGKDSALEELMALRGLPRPAADEVRIDGSDPFFRIPFRIGETVAATLAAIGVVSNDIWQMRTGRRQQVRVNVRHAAATVRTVDYSRAQNSAGEFHHIPLPTGMAYMLSVTQPWQAKDGRWVLPHFNLPHLAQRVQGVLQCEYTPEAVSEAVGKWDADVLETAIAEAQACGGKIRSPEEWLAHPQGQYLAARPVIEIIKLADGPPEPFEPSESGADRPLSGLRVLDLTRILAGPIAGRTLAEHGADVLMVNNEGLPQTPEHVRDTSHGKRSCFVDLTRPDELAQVQDLAASADVFINGYRPGKLEEHGLGVDALVARRPGLIYVTISCFGSGGPFAGRAGWEQVAQSVTGICQTFGERSGAGRPKLVFAPMCDYTTGYMGALGIMLALARRAREGGSYHVQVSLCQSAMFIQRQGLLDAFGDAPEKLTESELAPLHVEADTSYGRIRTLGPALGMSETPPHWATPTPLPGSDRPEWLPRSA